MTPEHRATLTRLLADIQRMPLVADGPLHDETVEALRAVLAVPEAGEGGAWESAEDFARRHAGEGAVTPLRNLYRDMTAERDAQTADRLEAICGEPGFVNRTVAVNLRTMVRDLRGLPR